MQERKKRLSRKYLSIVLLLLMSLPIPLQVTSKADILPYGQLKAKIGDTKTYEVTTVSGGTMDGVYNTSANKLISKHIYKVETGIKYTVNVTSLKWDPYQLMGLTGYYNVIITQKDTTNITTVAISVGYDYVPFLINGFENESNAINFVNNYNDFVNNLDLFAPDHAFTASFDNQTNEIVLLYVLNIKNGYSVFEYNYFNWTTGWLDKCLLQIKTKTNGELNVLKEVEILPIEAISKNTNGLQASVAVLVLGIPALRVLERRKGI